MVKAKKYVMIKKFKGQPKRNDFDIVEEELSELKDNEVLIEAEYLSVDPYMKGVMRPFQVPADMIGSQVGRIIESKHEGFPVGRRVIGQFGWRTHTIVNPDESYTGLGLPISLLLDIFDEVSPSLALGALGMPGNTAYFGVTDILKPKPSETVIVTGAAGAVGSVAGQIAKIMGCTVIGFAGSDDKCKWLKEELGFDFAINYKTANVQAALQDAAPKGVDCFFENVGGKLGKIINSKLNNGGRIAVCGRTSHHNDGLDNYRNTESFEHSSSYKINCCGIVCQKSEMRLTSKSFSVYDEKYIKRWDDAIREIYKWMKEGKIKTREHITEGFDKMYDAFFGMPHGENIGKALVKIQA